MARVSKSSLVELVASILLLFTLGWSFTLLGRGADDEVKVQLTQLAEAEKGDILLFASNRICIIAKKPYSTPDHSGAVRKLIAFTCEPGGPVRVAAITLLIQDMKAVIGPDNVYFGPLNEAFRTTGHAGYY